MSRKHCRRRVVLPVPPRGLRPRLLPEQVRTLAVIHTQVLDDVAKGRGDVESLWSVVAAVLLWMRVAEALGKGIDEMQEQHDLAMRMVARHAATGRVIFTGTDYQVAKRGTVVMDLLAETVDDHTAKLAATYSEDRTRRMQAAHKVHAAGDAAMH